MKKMTILLFILLISYQAFCPNSKVLFIEISEPVNPYENIWNATCSVESNYTDYIIGDKHLKHKSYGRAQIRKTRLKDYAKCTGIYYKEKDMFDPIKSKEVFMYYACQFYPSQLEEIASEWNAGPNWRNVKSVKNYYVKIQKALYEIKNKK